MKRTRTLNLTLLSVAALPLAACTQPAANADNARYARTAYSSYHACLEANRNVPGLQNPCAYDGGSWSGPYHSGTGSVIRYLGYARTGDVLNTGTAYNAATRSSAPYSEPAGASIGRAASAESISRGGFGSGARSGVSHGSFGG